MLTTAVVPRDGRRHWPFAQIIPRHHPPCPMISARKSRYAARPIFAYVWQKETRHVHPTCEADTKRGRGPSSGITPPSTYDRPRCATRYLRCNPPTTAWYDRPHFYTNFSASSARNAIRQVVSCRQSHGAPIDRSTAICPPRIFALLFRRTFGNQRQRAWRHGSAADTMFMRRTLISLCYTRRVVHDRECVLSGS